MFKEFKNSLSENAYSMLISDLEKNESLSKEIIKGIQLNVENYMVRELFQDKWKKEIIPSEYNGDISLDYIKMELFLWRNSNPLSIPLPEYKAELNGIKLAASAVIGGFLAIVFFFLISLVVNIFSLSLLSDRLYLVLFTAIVPVSCGLSVWFVWNCAHNGTIRKAVMSFLGLSAFFEVILLVNRVKGVFSFFRAGKGGFLSFIRIPFYLIVILVLKFTVKKPVYDNPEYRKLVIAILDLWIDIVIKESRLILATRTSKDTLPEKQKIEIKKLLSYIYKLYNSNEETLPLVASEIVSFVKTQGFEGLKNQPVFLSNNSLPPKQLIWENEMEKRYDSIGVVESGDTIFVESLPIIKNSVIISRGTVRKVRKTCREPVG